MDNTNRRLICQKENEKSIGPGSVLKSSGTIRRIKSFIGAPWPVTERLSVVLSLCTLALGRRRRSKVLLPGSKRISSKSFPESLMDRFSEEVREIAMTYLSGGFCMCSPSCNRRATEFHHKLANTKGNREKFPLFLQSIFNCCPINHDCHMSKGLPRILEREAVAYERYLKSICQSPQASDADNQLQLPGCQ